MKAKLLYIIVILAFLAFLIGISQARAEIIDCAKEDDPAVTGLGSGNLSLWIPNWQLLNCDNIEKTKQEMKKLGWCGKDYDLVDVLSGSKCADVTNKREFCTMTDVKINFKGFGCKK